MHVRLATYLTWLYSEQTDTRYFSLRVTLVTGDLCKVTIGRGRKQGAANREQRAGGREQGVGSREQGVGSREQRALPVHCEGLKELRPVAHSLWVLHYHPHLH